MGAKYTMYFPVCPKCGEKIGLGYVFFQRERIGKEYYNCHKCRTLIHRIGERSDWFPLSRSEKRRILVKNLLLYPLFGSLGLSMFTGMLLANFYDEYLSSTFGYGYISLLVLYLSTALMISLFWAIVSIVNIRQSVRRGLDPDYVSNFIYWCGIINVRVLENISSTYNISTEEYLERLYEEVKPNTSNDTDHDRNSKKFEVSTSSSTIMLYCRHCGKRNLSDSKFCDGCGKQVVQIEDSPTN